MSFSVKAYRRRQRGRDVVTPVLAGLLVGVAVFALLTLQTAAP